MSLPDHAGQWTRQAPAIRPRPAYVEQFMARVRTSPCSTAVVSDYTDARYFVDRATVTLASGEIAAVTEQTPGISQCITATNLAEAAAGTHLLAKGTVVQVFALIVRGVPDQKVYVFNCMPATSVVVKITGNSGGAGEYSGRILSGVSTATASSPLVMPAGLTVPAADDALVLNSEEDSLSGYRLAVASYATGVIVGQTSDSPPRQIVVVRGALGATASPTTIGSTSDTSESADTGSWSRSSSATPVNVYCVSRVVYNAAGDQTLYQFLRQISFDARGQLVSISAETRATVDATESCP
ncbi:MAG TPA: hypothetical protein VHY37_13120 [Tepidisphaeraceae bacterium]|nr:hypothetical protein [Tepidisphaeraceae bacterium]